MDICTLSAVATMTLTTCYASRECRVSSTEPQIVICQERRAVPCPQPKRRMTCSRPDGSTYERDEP